jgi:hypothetical protein
MIKRAKLAPLREKFAPLFSGNRRKRARDMGDYYSGIYPNPPASLTKAALAGFIGGLGSMALLGESPDVSVNYLGLITLSAPTAVGASVALGSLATDMLSSTVSRYVPGGEYAGAITGLGLSAGTTALILGATPGANVGSWTTSALVGGGSYAVADNLTHRIFRGGAGENVAW